MKPTVAFLVALIALTPAPSARQLVRLRRPLQPDEVHAVLDASRAAVANRTLVFTYLGREDGLQILMRADGWPRFIRGEGGMGWGVGAGVIGGASWYTEHHDYLIHLSDFTGTPARRCDGATLPGELVITYTHSRSTNKWTASADTKGAMPICNPVFDVLAERVRSVSDDAQDVDGHLLRGFTAPFSCPSGTYGLGGSSTDARQTLFIAADSLLPVRWQVSEGDRITDTRVLNYTSLEIRLPEGVEAPRCIP